MKRRRSNGAFQEKLSELQSDAIHTMQYISRMLMSNSRSANVIGTQMDDYLCEFENSCDNKGRKMMPNARKDRVVKDDTQFHLSVGLFTKISEDIGCEIYILPPDDASDFMYYNA